MVLGLEFSIVINLKQCPPHMSAHILAQLGARAALHIRENPFGFAVKSTPRRRKATHDSFKCCPQSPRPRVKRAPPDGCQRQPQREVSDMM